MNINNRIRLSIVAFAAVIAAGCANEKPKLSINDHFMPDNQPRAEQTIFAQQTANGARADGTLYSHHFTAGELNSLGRQKLESMTRGRELGMINIYLDVAKDDAYNSRESAVIAYLSHKGLASTNYAITQGANPALGSPVAPGLKGLAKQSAESATGGASSGSTGSTGGGMTGASK
jgi:hypothetical protein